jgi:hypothetical protein
MDIRYVIVILGAILCGFAQAFWLVSHSYNDDQFGTVSESFLTSFLFMLGQGTNADWTSNTVSKPFSTILLVIFVTFMSILLLNMLIAQMGDSFGIVRGKGPGQWRFEQASILLEQWFLINKEVNNAPPFLHVLQYVNINQIPTQNYNDLKEKIVSHIELLKYNMKEYSVNDVIYKANNLNEQILNSEKSIKSEMVINILSLENKLKSNNKINKKVLETKINTIALSIDNLENKFSHLEGELKSNIDVKNLSLETKLNRLEEKLNKLFDKLDSVLNI